MAETLLFPKNGTRAEIYRAITPQISAILDGEEDQIANLANVTAALKEAFGFFWVGFYLVKDDQLVLGPFQGPIACTRIAFDRGVCGHCYMTRKPVLVPNVDEFPGHIACSSASKSEVVLPLHSKEGRIIGVLDVDSDMLNDFSDVDVKGLEAILKLLAK
jgi:L-methionine (R)-S-oxide reductase